MLLRVVQFLMCSLISLKATALDPSIPTKEEQINLLRNVEEVFDAVKVMVIDEGSATDAAVVSEVQKTVQRALDYLTVLGENTFLMVSNVSENATHKEAKMKICTILQDGQIFLSNCVEEASLMIHNNSCAMTSITGSAMNQGQVLLDKLNMCSNKPGLQQISCYRKIIINDVYPLKLILVDAIKKHKSGHFEGIAIREKANECVESGLKIYKSKLDGIISEVMASYV